MTLLVIATYARNVRNVHVYLGHQKKFIIFAVSHSNGSSRTGIVGEASPLVDIEGANRSEGADYMLHHLHQGIASGIPVGQLQPCHQSGRAETVRPGWLELCCMYSISSGSNNSSRVMRCSFCDNNISCPTQAVANIGADDNKEPMYQAMSLNIL